MNILWWYFQTLILFWRFDIHLWRLLCWTVKLWVSMTLTCYLQHLIRFCWFLLRLKCDQHIRLSVLLLSVDWVFPRNHSFNYWTEIQVDIDHFNVWISLDVWQLLQARVVEFFCHQIIFWNKIFCPDKYCNYFQLWYQAWQSTITIGYVNIPSLYIMLLLVW